MRGISVNPSDNLPDKEKNVQSDSTRNPENTSSLWSGSSPSLDKLYNEIYNKRIQKLLDSENPAVFQTEVKKRVKSRLAFRITYNIVFLISAVLIVLNFSSAWFTEVKRNEARQVELYVHNFSVPAFVDANFNNAEFAEYSDEEIMMRKTMLPGDIINLSVFIDLRNLSNIKTVELKVGELLEWLCLLETPPVLTFANITSGENELPLELEKPGVAAVVPPPVLTDGTLTFRIEIPENTSDYDGLCLNFDIYFKEIFENQNEYLNKNIKLSFTATDIS